MCDSSCLVPFESPGDKLVNRAENSFCIWLNRTDSLLLTSAGAMRSLDPRSGSKTLGIPLASTWGISALQCLFCMCGCVCGERVEPSIDGGGGFVGGGCGGGERLHKNTPYISRSKIKAWLNSLSCKRKAQPKGIASQDFAGRTGRIFALKCATLWGQKRHYSTFPLPRHTHTHVAGLVSLLWMISWYKCKIGL